MPHTNAKRRRLFRPAASSLSSKVGPVPLDRQQQTAFIIRFHALLKQQAASPCVLEKRLIAKEMDEMGGLEKYQAMSVDGAAKGGGETGDWCMKGLGEVGALLEGDQKLRLLDIGSIAGTSYSAFTDQIDATYMDLNPGAEHVIKGDFLSWPPPKKDEDRYDVVSLSLVLNFVGDRWDRGRMLLQASSFLRRPHGKTKHHSYLYLVLPLACTSNSRYLSPTHLALMLESLGFELVWAKESARLGYWLARRKGEWDGREWGKKEKRNGRTCNNFCISPSGVPRDILIETHFRTPVQLPASKTFVER